MCFIIIIIIRYTFLFWALWYFECVKILHAYQGEFIFYQWKDRDEADLVPKIVPNAC